MAESERRQRTISSTPRLSPEEVANRAFGTSFRGLSESEVRSFLRRVSEELTASRDRERELTAAVDELEEQLRAPRPLDEQQLLDALGEETSRLLRSAREAAQDIRTRAEERAARVMEDAQAESRRLREEASEILGIRTEEAQARAAEIMTETEAAAAEVTATTERSAEEQRLRAETEAGGIVETALQQGREMIEEAKAAHERILTDLARRRALLQGQIEELRNGRDHLLDAYRVVKRTFLEATEALVQVEARAAAGLPISPSEAAETAAALGAEGEGVTSGAPIDLTAAEGEGEAGDDAMSALADVDTLFARIRAARSDSETDSGSVDTTPPGNAATTEEVAATQQAAAEAAGEDSSPREDARSAHQRAAEARGHAGDEWRKRRGDVLAAATTAALKASKRQAQDDQNALLDAVRRQKGRPAAAQVLSDLESLVESWASLLREGLDHAYAEGSQVGGGDAQAAPDDVARALAAEIVLPLRDRLTTAIDDAQDLGPETGGLVVERIGARYREWKNQSLEGLVGDALAAAWTRGVFDAAPDGALLHWIPVQEGRCADCDDNSLEPTAKGSPFPTGQAFPPAHPGCRCLLVPAEVLAATPV